MSTGWTLGPGWGLRWRAAGWGLTVLLVVSCVPGPSGPAKGSERVLAEPADRFIEEIMPYQVFPRKGRTGEIPFTTSVAGTVTAEVVRGTDRTAVTRQEWNVPSAVDPAGRSLAIQDVPVGGEYTIRFTAGNRTQVFDHILVGEIWILGGQSNAVGVLHDPDPPDPTVHFFRDGKWQEGIEPLFPVLFDSRPYVSAWRRAAQAYCSRTGIPVGMMGWAYGGVPMSRFWDAQIRDMPDFKDLVSQHGRGASAFLWYQGESDANPALYPVYADRLKAMASTIRRYAANPDLLMVVVQLSYLIDSPGEESPYVGRLREAQRRFCAADRRALLIPALPYPHRDSVHLDYGGYGELGRRIGECLAECAASGEVRWQGPRAVSARFTDETRTRIRVTFDSAEQLRVLDNPLGVPDSPTPRAPTLDWLVTDSAHQGYPEITRSSIREGYLEVQVAGTSLDSAGGQSTDHSIRIPLLRSGYLQPARITVEGLSVVLDLPMAAERGATVSYGLMSNSLCSLVDERGRAAATFTDLGVQEPPGAAP